jgi:hypothetical protein
MQVAPTALAAWASGRAGLSWRPGQFDPLGDVLGGTVGRVQELGARRARQNFVEARGNITRPDS